MCVAGVIFGQTERNACAKEVVSKPAPRKGKRRVGEHAALLGHDWCTQRHPD